MHCYGVVSSQIPKFKYQLGGIVDSDFEERVFILVHPTGEIILGQSATRVVIGALFRFDAFQVSRDDVLAFSCIISVSLSSAVCLFSR